MSNKLSFGWLFVFMGCVGLSSCSYVLPEGRQCRALRKEHSYWAEQNQSKQNTVQMLKARVAEKKNEITLIRKKLVSVRHSTSRAMNGRAGADAEIESLQNLLAQRQQELQQAEYQLKLAQ